VREGLQSELLRNEPPLLLFIGLSTGVEWLQTSLGWSEGPTKKHHVEGQNEPTQGRFSRPLVGPPRLVLSRGGCPVGPHPVST
jgi:hypothetical protein